MRRVVHDERTEIFLEIDEVLRLCKPGKKEDTCIWLVVGSQGFECMCMNRPIALIERWRAGQTVAKRNGCDEVMKDV